MCVSNCVAWSVHFTDQWSSWHCTSCDVTYSGCAHRNINAKTFYRAALIQINYSDNSRSHQWYHRYYNLQHFAFQIQIFDHIPAAKQYNLYLVHELNFSCKALTWCIVLRWGSFWPCDCSAVILFIYIFKHSCGVLLGVLVSCAAGLFLSRRILMFVRERRCGKEWSTSSCSYKLICITTGEFSPARPSPPFHLSITSFCSTAFIIDNEMTFI